MKPDLTILYGDRHLGFEPALLRLSREMDIKIVILQIADFAPTEVLLMSIRKFGKTLDDYNIRKKFISSKNIQNKSVKTKNSQFVSYYPKWLLPVLDNLKVLSPNPWTMGNNFVNVYS